MGKLKYILLTLLIICALGIAGSILIDEESPSNASSGPINPDWIPVYIDHEAGSPLDTTYSYAELVDKVSPAVVSIITENIEYDLFQQPYPTKGAGTGIIIDPHGYIVTNNHVVEGATSVTVILSSGEEIKAVKWASDSDTDLAVIEIKKEGLTYANFLEDSLSELRLGDKVMAIGNAGGRGIAPTEGTISYLGENIEIDGIPHYDLIRTSAAINPGNSGGPLVNMAGQVIGINVAKSATYEGFGFAISTNTAIPVIENLVKKGVVPPTWLGVYIANITPAIMSQYNLHIDYGAFIDSVISGSPAEVAGLQEGDVIIKFDDAAVNTYQDLATAIKNHEPGDKVIITFIRGEEEKTTEATLTQKPSS